MFLSQSKPVAYLPKNKKPTQTWRNKPTTPPQPNKNPKQQTIKSPPQSYQTLKSRTDTHTYTAFFKTTFLFKWLMTYRKLHRQFFSEDYQTRELRHFTACFLLTEVRVLFLKTIFPYEIIDFWRDGQTEFTQSFMLVSTE